MEINLKTLSQHAKEHWADNWNFRSYLRQNVTSEEIDKVAHVLTKKVSAAVDCTACGNCCREVQPYMTFQDVELVAAGSGKSTDEILSMTRIEDGHHLFCKSPCPMLKHNKCTIYKSRPVDCREYPHCDKPDFIARSIGFIENYGTCPIIYNIWGRLKDCFAYDSSVDYIGDADPEVDH